MPFNPKAKKFVRGRQMLLKRIQQQMAPDTRSRIWIHCASLGEFEQGRPVIEAIKQNYPALSIVLTFFSPSGYEVKKSFEGADHIFYLPLDSPKNARRFIAIIQPRCALFVKYEFWYHYLSVLHQQGIPTLLFSAIFQPRHPFFKWYGGLYRKMLGFYQQIFVQQEASRALLESLSLDPNTIQIAGDTRFDRAAKVLKLDKSFPAIEAFKAGDQLMIAGSTWRDDDLLLQKTLQQLPDTYKLLIAPHETDETSISRLRSLFPGSCLWGTDEVTLRNSRVCIVDTVGQLAYLYKYATMVWIGGGFTHSGIHNVIEPAVFGKPVLFGPNYERYREATEMITAGAAASLTGPEELLRMIHHKNALLQMGSNAKQYVHSQLGATDKIMHYLSEKCLFNIP